MPKSDKCPLPIALTEALTHSWLTTQTPAEIGSDVEKIQLLQRVAREVPDPTEHMSNDLQQLYKEVFLRDVSAVAA